MIIVSWKENSMENIFGGDSLYDLSTIFFTGSVLRLIFGMRLIGLNWCKLLIQIFSCFSYNFPLLLIRYFGSSSKLPGLSSVEYLVEKSHPYHSPPYDGSHFCLASCCCLEGCLWKGFSFLLRCGNFVVLDPSYHWYSFLLFPTKIW